MGKSNCYFNCSFREYLSHSWLPLFLEIITGGLYTPWALVKMWQFKAEHTVMNNQEVKFNGTGGELLKLLLIQLPLIIITLGIYFPWALCRILKWKAEHTLVGGKPSQFNNNGRGLLGLFFKLGFFNLGIYLLFFGLIFLMPFVCLLTAHNSISLHRFTVTIMTC